MSGDDDAPSVLNVPTRKQHCGTVNGEYANEEIE
jgi:hypothetical protein